MSIKPQHLFDQARALAAAPVQGAPRQVDLRRAVLATYYAIFHFVLTTLADEFIGVGQRSSVPYGLIYRSVAHRSVFACCKEAVKTNPEKKWQPFFPLGGFSPELKQFAAAFISLQQRRHLADYDPRTRFERSDVVSEIAQGQNALTLFDQAAQDQRLLFLSLIAFPPKS